MAVFEKRLLRDSTDVLLQLWGGLEEGEELNEIVLEPSKLKEVSSLRLTDVTYSIQSGLTVLLFWEGESDHTLMLPLEGRGRLDYSWCSGLRDPQDDGWTGNVLFKTVSTGQGAKHFSLVLEFAKCR